MIYREPYIVIEPYTGGLNGNPHKIGTREWQDWYIKELKGIMTEIKRHVNGFSGSFAMDIEIVTPIEENTDAS